jgi:hypothetical protein
MVLVAGHGILWQIKLIDRWRENDTRPSIHAIILRPRLVCRPCRTIRT